MASMCQSLEIQPRISQTPLCTEITVRLCLLSLPAPSHLPSLAFSASTATLYLSPAVSIFSTLHSVLPVRNQPWQTNSLSLQLLHPSWIKLGGLGTAARITVQFLTSDGSCFLPGKLSCTTLVFSSLLREDGCLKLSLQLNSKFKSLSH